jgi:hypothetical protein
VSIDTQVAEQFGNALAKGDFAQAHVLLTEEVQNLYSPAVLEQEVKAMTAYAEGPIQEVEVMGTLDAWPDKLEGDVAWVYVALTGDSFAEAVTVVLTNTANGIRIRWLEWGRP